MIPEIFAITIDLRASEAGNPKYEQKFKLEIFLNRKDKWNLNGENRF